MVYIGQRGFHLSNAYIVLLAHPSPTLTNCHSLKQPTMVGIQIRQTISKICRCISEKKAAQRVFFLTRFFPPKIPAPILH